MDQAQVRLRLASGLVTLVRVIKSVYGSQLAQTRHLGLAHAPVYGNNVLF